MPVAPQLPTFSTISALSGRDLLVLSLSACDAVDGAHSAASKCQRVVA